MIIIVGSLLEAKEKLGRAQFTSDLSDLDDNTNVQNLKNINSNVNLAQSMLYTYIAYYLIIE